MPVVRSSAQTSKSLDEFYAESINSPNAYENASMLLLIRMLNKYLLETAVYGLTSHQNLKLFPIDNEIYDFSIFIECKGHFYYHIQYRIPKGKRPWENAFVVGYAKDLDEAIQFVLISMYECGGWADSVELKKLIGFIPRENGID